MGMRINTNLPAIQAQSSLGKVNQSSQDTISKLSSGQRIVRASDDAAGLAISEKLKAHIRSGKQADRNANDGISLVQVAEGGLSESSNLLTRMRELAMQSATDTLSNSDRSMISYEYENLKQELERISQSTDYNGHKLLNGSAPRLDFHVGVGHLSDDDVIYYDAGRYNSGIRALGVASSAIRDKRSAQASLGQIDGALSTIGGQRAMLGSLQSRLVTSSNNLGFYNENMQAANSRIRDVDFADEASKLAKNSVVQQAGVAVAAQANTEPRAALNLLR